MFLNELQLCGKTAPYELGIVDEDPARQRLYLEFLVYQQIFKKNNIKTEILDIKQVSEKPNFLR